MEHYLASWKKYAVFSGRARRKEFFAFFAGNSAIISALPMLAAIPHFAAIPGAGIFASGINIARAVFVLAAVVPSLAVIVRRLHDTGRNGWALSWATVPLVGQLVLLAHLLKDSAPGENQFGPNPKADALPARGVPQATAQTAPSAPQAAAQEAAGQEAGIPKELQALLDSPETADLSKIFHAAFGAQKDPAPKPDAQDGASARAKASRASFSKTNVVY